MTVAGSRAYVADSEAGLQVIDVSNPANCVRVGAFDTSRYSHGVVVAGDYAYIADTIGGLQVIDVSNPTNCVRVGGYDTGSGNVGGAAGAGNYAYVANVYAAYAELEVIDVSDPTRCRRVGGIPIRRPLGVTVSGNYAFVADNTAGLQVIDVSNPTNCMRVGGYDTRGNASGVTVAGDRIYVADGGGGLLVLPTLPNVQSTVQVDATPGVPFTIEAATNLSDPNSWQPLLTTNVATMPFDFVDFDVKLSEKPHKFYRVRQP